VWLEDYDINVARYLVQGVDVWLNNPRRPLEASGTSGMKVCCNGALNLSVLDGWWVEGYAQDNGWAIGAGEEYTDLTYQDDVESPGAIPNPRTVAMSHNGAHEGSTWVFNGSIRCRSSGQHGFAVRVLPRHADLANPFESGLICWG